MILWVNFLCYFDYKKHSCETKTFAIGLKADTNLLRKTPLARKIKRVNINYKNRFVISDSNFHVIYVISVQGTYSFRLQDLSLSFSQISISCQFYTIWVSRVCKWELN